MSDLEALQEIRDEQRRTREALERLAEAVGELAAGRPALQGEGLLRELGRACLSAVASLPPPAPPNGASPT